MLLTIIASRPISFLNHQKEKRRGDQRHSREEATQPAGHGSSFNHRSVNDDEEQ